MSYIYKSLTDRTVNIASYVITESGMYAEMLVPELDALVGVTIQRVDETYQEPVVEPEKSTAPSAPEPEPTPAPVEVVAE